MRIQELTDLDNFDKLKIYLKYYIHCITFDNTLSLVLKTDIPSFSNFPSYGKYTKPYKEFERYYIFKWKPLLKCTFDEFVSLDNIKYLDHGENWEKRGLAQRYTTTYEGIYYWYYVLIKQY